MSTLLYVYYERLYYERETVNIRLRMLSEAVVSGSVVDSYYIPENSTVVVVLYLSEPIETSVVRAYIDNRPVPEANYTSGFGVPIPIDEFFKVSFVANLTPGRHTVLLITEWGGRIEATIWA